MPRGIFLLKDDGNLIEMNETDYDSEDVLQELLEHHPNLLAGDQIDEINPRKLLLIKREASIPGDEFSSGRWSVDHLFVDQDGIPTLIEVKRSTDTRIRREVVGQMLDYAANAIEYWSIDKIRSSYETNCENKNLLPEQEFMNQLQIDIDYNEFWQKVKTNLQMGRIRMIFVADEIPFELRRVVEFLNEQMDFTEVLAIEIKQFIGENQKTLVPRLIGQTTKAQSKKIGKTERGRQWDETSFMIELERSGRTSEIEVAKKLVEWAKNKGLRIWWGKGKQLGSFFPMLDYKNISYYLFALWTNGWCEIQFQWMKNRPIYDEIEKRKKLLKKLNQIMGDIPEHGIDGKPSFSYSLLEDKVLFKDFINIWENYISEIKQN